jgi:hypothetical protein
VSQPIDLVGGDANRGRNGLRSGVEPGGVADVVCARIGVRENSRSSNRHTPMSPTSGETKVSTSVVCRLVIARAPWMSSLATTSTPRPFARSSDATPTAL